MISFQSMADKFLAVTHGRTTAFFAAFFVVGHVVVFLDKLTPTYIGFMATLGGLVLGHSIKEDVVNGRTEVQGDKSNANGKS